MQLGINFGTCNSSAALIIGESLILVKDSYSQNYLLPSSVFVTPSGKLVVGQAADEKSFKDPTSYRQVKRELDINSSDDPIFLNGHPFHIENFIAAILDRLKRDADIILKSRGLPPLTGAVLTVPAEYQEDKRGIMLRAATATGFTSEDVIFLEEPKAAVLDYAHQRDVREGEVLLIYDLGGYTFDTVLLKKVGTSYEYLVTPARVERGGIDFDNAIYTDIVNHHPELKDLLSGDRMDALRARCMTLDYCMKLKHQLTDAEDAEISLYLPGVDIDHHLTQQDFNGMITPYVRETINCCQRMMRHAKLEWKQIDRILLVGGSCRIPFIEREIQREFQRPVFLVDDPELAICKGAAIYASHLEKLPFPPSDIGSDDSPPIAVGKKLEVSLTPPSGVRNEDSLTTSIVEGPKKTPLRQGESYKVLKDPWDM